MIPRRIVVNLGVFVAIAALLIAYGMVSLLGSPLSSTTTLYALFPDGSGMRTHFAVTDNGVDVGSVSAVKLVPGGVRVTMTIDPGVRIPAGVRARIDWANALGEQQVDLVPSGGRTGHLANGATVPIAPDGTPVQVGEVVQTATRLLKSLPVGDLNSFLQQLSTAFQGRAQDMRTIIEASSQASQEFLQYQDAFVSLLQNAPPLLNAVASVGPQLTQALSNTTVLTGLLADRRYDLVRLMDDGATAAQVTDALLATEKANLACSIHDFSQVVSNIADSANLANLDASLGTSNWFFGAINRVAPLGPTVSLYSGDPAKTDQEWLRTRLLLPPPQPPADAYGAPVGVPQTLPGAACDTVEFGNGVGPATQATPENRVPGATVVPPTASQSQVSGGG